MKNLTVYEFVDGYMQIGTELMIVRTNYNSIETRSYEKSILIAECVNYETKEYDIQEMRKRVGGEMLDKVFPDCQFLQWNYDEDKWEDFTEEVEEFLDSDAECWNDFINPERRDRE